MFTPYEEPPPVMALVECERSGCTGPPKKHQKAVSLRKLLYFFIVAPDMKQAVETLKSKTVTIRKAAIKFYIPFETLRRRCKIAVQAQHPGLCKKKLGRFSPVLSADQKNELVQYICRMEISCYGLTIAVLRRLGINFVRKTKLFILLKKTIRWLVETLLLDS